MGKVFDYYKASSVADVLSVLSKLENARVIAGGTDLLLQLLKDNSTSAFLVDITGIKELEGIKFTDKCLRIGSITRMADVAKSNLLTGSLQMLVQGAASVGSPQIRNLATIGGNICNASPAADMAAPLLAIDAKAEIMSLGGTRIIPLKDFFTGPGQTVLAADEILLGITIPMPVDEVKGIYLKHTIRGAMDIAIVGVAILLWKENSSWRTRISLSAVAPTPIRALMAEEVINSAKNLDQKTIISAAELASREIYPISDIRASTEYRCEITKVFIKRILNQLSAVCT